MMRKLFLFRPVSTSPSWSVTTTSTLTRFDSTEMELAAAEGAAPGWRLLLLSARGLGRGGLLLGRGRLRAVVLAARR